MASDAEKYIIKLKEPLWRRALRYFLWGVIVAAVLSLLLFTLYFVGRALVGASRASAIEDMAEGSPLKAVSQAETGYNRNRTVNAQLDFVEILIKVGKWQLADLMMDSLRPPVGFRQKAYDLVVSSHTAPESAQKLRLSLKEEPQTEEEILALGEVAVAIPDTGLRARAHHWLRSVGNPPQRYKARLLLAELFAQEGEVSQCRELASRLWEKPLSVSDSMRLLRLCKNAKLPGCQDYQSMLKISARKNAALALAMANELSKEEEPQQVVDWLLSLPKGVSASKDVALKVSELLAKAGKQEEAVLALKKGGDMAVSLFSGIVYNKASSVKETGFADLLDAAQYAQNLSNFTKEQEFLNRIIAAMPARWDLKESYDLLERQGDELALISRAAALDKALGGNLLLEAQSAYWQLISYDCDAKPLYETLKRAVARYPDRRDVALSMALAHYRLGNLTDAINMLPQEPASPREKLVCAYLWAKAREFNKAGAIVSQIETGKLSPSELALYKNTLSLLQADAPLERWIKLLK
jgi:hypothetical protein